MSEDLSSEVIHVDTPNLPNGPRSPKWRTFLKTHRLSLVKPSHRQLWLVIGGALGGFVLGGVVFRWSRFWTWLTSADWTSLPAVIIGTAIPAFAGVAFAQSFASRSMKTLRKAELEATDEYKRQRAGQEASEKEARRNAWDQIYDACKAFTDRSDDDAFIKSVRDHSKNVHGQDSQVTPQVGAAAWYGMLWGAELRSHLPNLVNELRILVSVHGVEKMRVPLNALEILLPLAKDERSWLPMDPEEIRRAVEESRGEIPICAIGAQSETAIHYLGIIADRQRTVPHDADDVDCFIERQTSSYTPKDGLRSHTSKIDALRDFARVVDLIQQFVDPKY